MEAWQRVVVRAIWRATFGFVALMLPLAAQQAQPVQGAALAPSVSQASSTANSAVRAGVSEFPDSPDVILSANGESSPLQGQNARELWAAALMQPRFPGAESGQNEAPQTQSSPNQSTQTPSSAAPLQTSPQQKPVGTAAAEAPSASGVAASQPAGVAIAPAKQRRVRTIVLRTGAIIGAGVAVGTVVALTAGTSSKPPGAH